MKQSLVDVRKILDQANQCRNDTWQWWAFTAKNQKLVLCGYQQTFNVTGYLVFYNPVHVSIPHYIGKAVVGLDTNSSVYQSSSQVGKHYEDVLCITFEAPQSTYFVVCESVQFFPSTE